MKYTVNITASAQTDILNIDDYIRINLSNEQAANNIVKAIFKEIIILEQYPYCHPIIADEYLAILNIRAIPIKNYIIFYTVGKETKSVAILRILHSRQNWADIIKETISYTYSEICDNNGLLSEETDNYGYNI